VWGEKTYAWEPSFLDVLAQSYGTGIYLADFENNPDAAEQAINGWVSCERRARSRTCCLRTRSTVAR
jgi:serine protease inhibitor